MHLTEAGVNSFTASSREDEKDDCAASLGGTEFNTLVKPENIPYTKWSYINWNKEDNDYYQDPRNWNVQMN